MLRFETIVFDLDGTLIDTSEGIHNCFRYALEKMGLPSVSAEQLHGVIGPPLQQSLERFLGGDSAAAAEAVRLYRERYRDKGMHECSPYPGIIEMLSRLHSAGAALAICTAKAEDYARPLLEAQGVLPYLSLLRGYALTDVTERKPELLAECLSLLPHRPAVMVGDRINDIEAAHACSIPALGAAYGYGSPSELSAALATFKDVPSMEAYLFSASQS